MNHPTLNQITDALYNLLITAEAETDVLLFKDVRKIQLPDPENIDTVISGITEFPASLISLDRVNYFNVNAVRKANLRLIVVPPANAEVNSVNTLLDQTAALLTVPNTPLPLTLDGINYQIRYFRIMKYSARCWEYRILAACN